MAEFLVEIYVSRADGVAAGVGAASARLAAEALSREGTPVRFLQALFVPDDETCFYLYEAARAEDVAEAARRASLPFERVSEAIGEPKGGW